MTPDEPMTIRSKTRQPLMAGVAQRIGRALGVLAIATLATLACGCGDEDDNPMTPDANEPDRSTPSTLLTTFFETVYSTQDSTLYRAMLDSEFTFEFLQADADSLRDVLGTDNAWGRTEDIQSTEAMFANASVTGVTLNLLVNSNAAFPDTIGCVSCRLLEATVTLRVATIGDGTEPLIYTVDAPQTFITKKDPADSTKWVLWRQHDLARSQPNAFGKTRAVESKSWGEIKGVFFPYTPLPRPDRATPTKLLTDFFETAYSRQDSALYAEMLDPGFQFQFLQADADSLRDVIGVDNFWGRTLDLRSTGNMFRSEEITGITLNLQVASIADYFGDDCINCRQLETTATLRIATIGDGTEPLIFTLDSPAAFVVKPDAEDSAQWVLFRQIDRPCNAPNRGDSRSGPATECGSWGEIKGLFR